MTRSIPRRAIRIDLPIVAQVEDHTCGPAALLSIASYYGVLGALEWEHQLERAMRITRAGSDPHHLVAAARRFGLTVEEHQPMSDATLRRLLGRRRPVLIMLQAWSGKPRPRYRDDWRDGHWVVAIGHDKAGVYFADPALHTSRGFLGWRELDERWHDVGYRGVHLERYGAAIWKPGVRRSQHGTRARRIQ